MSSDDSSTTDSWASTIDSFDTTTSDSDSDSSDGGLNFAHLAAQAAGLVVQDEDGPSDDDDEDAWLRRENRPQTLAAAMLLLPGRRFVHETRHTPEQFEYMCTKLEVPDIIPTPEQRLHSSTCVRACGLCRCPAHPPYALIGDTHTFPTHPPIAQRTGCGRSSSWRGSSSSSSPSAASLIPTRCRASWRTSGATTGRRSRSTQLPAWIG